ncbi:putative NAD(P)-binding protein [Brevibacterium sanguinis]|uniref:NAD(P)-binding protein n=2 Tax=Brevibacterium TaxID=1696 RepID=A0ABX9GTI9_9MICO|nr:MULTISPECIES: NAD(P)H-binding protein [Brevibacterium]RBP67911.1 putative NAD(P)-binding protein [Brevibacterium sanguinis]RBP74672.1 putative NAD(P)-binding protein [Brevibacterium celere]
MHIAIVGGHGQIALKATELLLTAGHEVTSIIRRPEQVEEIEALGAQARVCDVETADAAELAAAIAGADALVFAAGAGPGSTIEAKRGIDLGGSLKSIDACLEIGIRRFVQISFIGVTDPVPEGTDPVFAAYWEAKREADEALISSGLAYTIVKPGRLTDEPATGTGEVGVGSSRGVTTARATVAEFIRMVLEEPRTAGLSLDISDGDTPLRQALEGFLQTED